MSANVALIDTRENQLPIMLKFYENMDASELTWLIRVILRFMKIGATDRTFFNAWHPDAAGLFNVTSNLRKICWDLWDPDFRLTDSAKDVSVMQPFQPQLAGFNKKDCRQILRAMDFEPFWVEQKLDGERMQLHMQNGDFKFFSRKAKDYTYLYGSSVSDPQGSLTRHLGHAFDENVDSIILDGEMITWDVDVDAMVPFGTLKSAVIEEQRRVVDSPGGVLPLFKVFDILYLNGTSLVNAMLGDRNRILNATIKPISRRFEIHEHTVESSEERIGDLLQQVIAESTEGLVIKNPKSLYSVNARNDDWIKLKPEYMKEYGEKLDCLVMGAYFGHGRRGGIYASFLCGLRVDNKSKRFISFFKVGGGFTANDYKLIMHRLEPYAIPADTKKKPSYYELAGGQREYEKPDVWIPPEHSIVLAVKAASVTSTDQFCTLFTLRFPRFQRVHEDKGWEEALTVKSFQDLQKATEEEHKQNLQQFTTEIRRQVVRNPKRVVIHGNEAEKLNTPPTSELLKGRTFYIMTPSETLHKSKGRLEELVKSYGARVIASAQENCICIAEKNVIKVASLLKKGGTNMIKPQWICDCVTAQAVLPFEPCHFFYFKDKQSETIAENQTDQYGDGFASVCCKKKLETIFANMKLPIGGKTNTNQLDILTHHSSLFQDVPGWIFLHCRVYVVENVIDRLQRWENVLRFGGAAVCDHVNDSELTHIITDAGHASQIRQEIVKVKRNKYPRFVTRSWVEESWSNKTLLDEERFAV